MVSYVRADTMMQSIAVHPWCSGNMRAREFVCVCGYVRVRGSETVAHIKPTLTKEQLKVMSSCEWQGMAFKTHNANVVWMWSCGDSHKYPHSYRIREWREMHFTNRTSHNNYILYFNLCNAVMDRRWCGNCEWVVFMFWMTSSFAVLAIIVHSTLAGSIAHVLPRWTVLALIKRNWNVIDHYPTPKRTINSMIFE